MSKNARLITEQQKQRSRNRQPNHSAHPPHPLLHLQHNAGNHAIQAKLSVNPPGDIYEQEADRVAANIIKQEHDVAHDSGSNPALMRQTEPEEEEEEPIQAKFSNSQLFRQEEEEEEIQPKRSPDFVQRQEMPEEEEELHMKRSSGFVQRQEEEEYAQMKPSSDAILRQEEQEEEELIQPKSSKDSVPQVDTSLEQRINSAHGSGQRLPASVSTSFESNMGHDLSQVRVHTGSEAHSLSRSLQAEAFTTGNDIFFRSGRYNPGSESGRELLAHEVTHVAQQGAAPALRKEE